MKIFSFEADPSQSSIGCKKFVYFEKKMMGKNVFKSISSFLLSNDLSQVLTWASNGAFGQGLRLPLIYACCKNASRCKMAVIQIRRFDWIGQVFFSVNEYFPSIFTQRSLLATFEDFFIINLNSEIYIQASDFSCFKESSSIKFVW